MTAIMELLSSWDAVQACLGGAFFFGFAPGFALRLILLAYPKGHPRRRELIGELYAMRRLERPFFVFEQLELALFEGLPLRRAERRAREINDHSAATTELQEARRQFARTAVVGGVTSGTTALVALLNLNLFSIMALMTLAALIAVIISAWRLRAIKRAAERPKLP